jgi:hypothetical protein
MLKTFWLCLKKVLCQSIGAACVTRLCRQQEPVGRIAQSEQRFQQISRADDGAAAEPPSRRRLIGVSDLRGCSGR